MAFAGGRGIQPWIVMAGLVQPCAGHPRRPAAMIWIAKGSCFESDGYPNGTSVLVDGPGGQRKARP